MVGICILSASNMYMQNDERYVYEYVYECVYEYVLTTVCVFVCIFYEQNP